MSLVRTLSESMDIEPDVLLHVMKTQVLSDPDASNAELVVVMSVMRDLGLSPMNKEVHAWKAKGKLHVMVGYDGWVKFARRNANFDYVSYEESDEEAELGRDRVCPLWIKPTLHLKDGATVPFPKVRLREWYLSNKEPWINHPSHRLRQKAYCLLIREHYGMHVLDEADMEQIQFHDDPSEVAGEATKATVETEADRMREKMAKVKHQEKVEVEAEEAEYEEVAEVVEETSTEAAGDEVETERGGLVNPSEDVSQDGARDEVAEVTQHNGSSPDLGEVCSALACTNSPSYRCTACSEKFCESHKHEKKVNTCLMCGLGKG
jgi:hypothetical protein